MNYPTLNPIAAAQRRLSAQGQPGATQLITVQELSAALAAGATSAPIPVQFPSKGWVVGIFGQEIAGTLAQLAQTSVRVQMGNGRDLFTDTFAPSFASLLMLVGANFNYFALERAVSRDERWQVTYRDGGAGSTPRLAFAFVEDLRG